MEEKMDKLDSTIKQIFTKMKKIETKPSDCPDEMLLAAYIDNTLQPEDKSKIEEHLMLCNECLDTVVLSSKAKKETFSFRKSPVTKDMTNKAKGLIRQPYEDTLWEKISDWLKTLTSVPVMATVSVAVILMVVSFHNLQIFHGPSKKMSVPARLNIIAKIQGLDGTRSSSKDYNEIEIEDGSSLNSGNLFKIKFQLEEGAYTYLISLDSNGNITKLYPDDDTEEPVKLEPNKEFFFPKEDSWLKLDDNKGKESFYLLTSKEPIQDIDSEIDQLKNLGIDKMSEIFPMIKIQSFVFDHK